MYLGEATYSTEAESAAFAKLHNINVAIVELRGQGIDYAFLLPSYRAALDAYRAAGNNDPAYLTSAEQFYLDASRGVAALGQVANTLSNKLLLGGALLVVGLYLWRRH